jgi:hypothetical protein
MNGKMILGILLLSVGTFLVDMVLMNARHHRGPAHPLVIELTCFMIMIVGACFIFKGKKKQLEDRKNRN